MIPLLKDLKSESTKGSHYLDRDQNKLLEKINGDFNYVANEIYMRSNNLSKDMFEAFGQPKPKSAREDVWERLDANYGIFMDWLNKQIKKS